MFTCGEFKVDFLFSSPCGDKMKSMTDTTYMLYDNGFRPLAGIS